MPIQSKYDDEKFNEILQDVLLCLEKHQVNADLALMVLGNSLTHILNQQADVNVRKNMTEQFCAVLKKTTQG
jgi:uncharacterized protein YejL (UPF0352 family)